MCLFHYVQISFGELLAAVTVSLQGSNALLPWHHKPALSPENFIIGSRLELIKYPVGQENAI